MYSNGKRIQKVKISKMSNEDEPGDFENLNIDDSNPWKLLQYVSTLIDNEKLKPDTHGHIFAGLISYVYKAVYSIVFENANDTAQWMEISVKLLDDEKYNYVNKVFKFF